MRTLVVESRGRRLSPGRWRGALQQAAAVLRMWRHRRRSRRALAALPPHLLRDIGIDGAGAAVEAGKPFWRP